MQSTNVYDIYKMETFFMNTKNSKTSEPHRLMLDLKNPNKNMALASLSIYYTWKNVKSTYNNSEFKIPHLHGMIHLIYLMDRIIFQLYKIILNI